MAAEGIVYRILLDGLDSPTDIAAASHPGVWKHQFIRGVSGCFSNGGALNSSLQELAFGTEVCAWDDAAEGGPPAAFTVPNFTTFPAQGAQVGTNWMPMGNLAAVLPRNIYNRHGVSTTGHVYRIHLKGNHNYFDALAKGWRFNRFANFYEIGDNSCVSGIGSTKQGMVEFMGYGGEYDGVGGYGGPVTYPISVADEEAIEAGLVYLPMSSVRGIQRMTCSNGASELYIPSGTIFHLGVDADLLLSASEQGLTTEDGIPITTEDGVPITTEPDDAS